MAEKTATRMARAYSLTFDEPGDRERYSAHAKKHGRTLAGLIKYLLATDAKAVVLPVVPAGG